MDPVGLDELIRGLPVRSCVDLESLPVITGICTDSRKIRPGDLFFALKGEHSDGHEYVGAALNGGAAAAVVSESFEGDGGPLVVVADPLRFLGETARHYRRRFAIPVVAVTGSVGKTSVKEMIAAALRTRFRVHANPLNYNNEIGVPLTLYGLSSQDEVAILEMGMRGEGEIDWLATVAEPTIAVITNIGHSHLERLGSRDAIARAKAELLARLPADGIAVIPLRDDYFDYLKSRVPAGCRVVTFSDGREDRSRVSVDHEVVSPAVVVDGRMLHRFSPEVPGHVARNTAAAIAVAELLGVPPEAGMGALASVQPVAGRLRVLGAPKGVTIIDDCYNAAPESMAAALGVLRDAGEREPYEAGAQAAVARIQPRRRVAILGDMRELGESGPALHRALGLSVIDANVDLLVTVGELAREIASETAKIASRDDRPSLLHSHFADTESAVKGIGSLLLPGDCVLVKGSRAMEMEHIVTALAPNSEFPHG